MAEQLYQRDIYGQTLVELGSMDKNIVVLDADLSSSTRTNLFAKQFPDRFFNLGVAGAEYDGHSRRSGLLRQNGFCFDIRRICFRGALGIRCAWR